MGASTSTAREKLDEKIDAAFARFACSRDVPPNVEAHVRAFNGLGWKVGWCRVPILNPRTRNPRP
jgi:hypothetical protein